MLLATLQVIKKSATTLLVQKSLQRELAFANSFLSRSNHVYDVIRATLQKYFLRQAGALKQHPLVVRKAASANKCLVHRNHALTKQSLVQNVVNNLQSLRIQSAGGRDQLRLYSFALLGLAYLKESDGPAVTGDKDYKLTSNDIVDVFSKRNEEEMKNNRADDSQKDVFTKDINDYEIKERLGSPSSDAAVYEAECHGRKCALKMMFNSESSESGRILAAFAQEYHLLASSEDDPERLLTHPNIIRVEQVLTGRMIANLPDSHTYESWLPTARGRSESFGRTRTLYLVMPKFEYTLREFMAKHGAQLTLQQKMEIAYQIFEGVAYLEKKKIAHRDLKSDNVLVNVEINGEDIVSMQVVITDFGHCLSQEGRLTTPYESRQVSPGGNARLMAPEIICPFIDGPRPGKVLDFSKSDVWAAATLVYEIFGSLNPFYCHLDSQSYADCELPPLLSDLNELDYIVQSCLVRDPDERLSAEHAATAVFILLHAPRKWWQTAGKNQDDLDLEILVWLFHLNIRIHSTANHDEPAKKQFLAFLARTNVEQIQEIVQCISGACEAQVMKKIKRKI